MSILSSASSVLRGCQSLTVIRRCSQNFIPHDGDGHGYVSFFSCDRRHFPTLSPLISDKPPEILATLLLSFGRPFVFLDSQDLAASSVQLTWPHEGARGGRSSVTSFTLVPFSSVCSYFYSARPTRNTTVIQSIGPEENQTGRHGSFAPSFSHSRHFCTRGEKSLFTVWSDNRYIESLWKIKARLCDPTVAVRLSP